MRIRKSNLFEKNAVSALIVSGRYGLQLTRGSMIRCPFHEDKTPTMKPNEVYYCFGCKASGSVVDFTAKSHGLTQHVSTI